MLLSDMGNRMHQFLGWSLTPREPTVIYEDDQLFIINKPIQMPSNQVPSSQKVTAIDWACEHSVALKNLGKKYEYGLVHRLDETTSGILVFAKHLDEWERLKRLWKQKEVQKIYECLTQNFTHRPILQKYCMWMGHSKKSKKKMLISFKESTLRSRCRGKLLVAESTLLAVRSFDLGYLEWTIQIHTGIMHQIRATMSYLGYPLLGDTLYEGLSHTRIFLHAQKISFLTVQGKLLTLIALKA